MAIDFSHMPCIYWSNTTKMSYLQRRVIVHSIIYYEMSSSTITDREFDSIGHQLVELMNSSTKEECERSTYWYAMYDFDASTGFNIPSRLTKKDRQYLTNIASHVLHQYRTSGRSEGK